MKELSIEEKAKAYDEALEVAKKLYQDCPNGKNDRLYHTTDLEKIFPELAESEDEVIRKEIISFIQDAIDEINLKVSGDYDDRDEDDIAHQNWCKKAIAWLEKQGESYIKKDVDNAYLEGMAFAKDELEKQGEQKPADKVEPKFKVGDWVVFDGETLHITNVTEKGYSTEDGVIPFRCEKETKLWTIDDAKPGNVLVNGANIFIFHFINDTRLMGYCHVNTDDGRFYDDIGKNTCFCLIDAVVNPATKEQRDLLFQKMKEAGYEWDSEKKELKNIDVELTDFEKVLKHIMIETLECGDTRNLKADAEMLLRFAQKPAEWSEEDERMRKDIIRVFKGEISFTSEKENEKYTAWLKSLKERYTWKPSDEQMEALHDLNLTGNISYVGQGQELINLYNDLKKLKGE